MITHWNIYAHIYKSAFKKAFNLMFWVILIGIPVWYFFLKRPVYQWIYGTPTDIELKITPTDIFQDLPAQLPPGQIKGWDFDVRVDFLKFFHTVTKVVYVDRYNFLGTWYRASGPEQYKKAVKVYDKVAPLDISTVNGVSAKPEMMTCFEFSHEYRYLWTKIKRDKNCHAVRYIDEDINNNHTIPANETVAKGLAILKAGDIAYLEGYAVAWEDVATGEGMISSTYVGQVHEEQLYGGKPNAGLCRQLFLTRIIFDGYEFK